MQKRIISLALALMVMFTPSLASAKTVKQTVKTGTEFTKTVVLKNVISDKLGKSATHNVKLGKKVKRGSAKYKIGKKKCTFRIYTKSKSYKCVHSNNLDTKDEDTIINEEGRDTVTHSLMVDVPKARGYKVKVKSMVSKPKTEVKTIKYDCGEDKDRSFTEIKYTVSKAKIKKSKLTVVYTLPVKQVKTKITEENGTSVKEVKTVKKNHIIKLTYKK